LTDGHFGIVRWHEGVEWKNEQFLDGKVAAEGYASGGRNAMMEWRIVSG
jgi:hypothetical protein